MTADVTSTGLIDPEELAAWLRLGLTPGVGNATGRQLLAAFGMPPNVFAQSGANLAHCVGAKISAALCREPDDLQALLDVTLQWLQSNPAQHRVLTLGDPSYPQSLLQMEDPPLLLYAKGTALAWEKDGLRMAMAHSIAIVGSRNPTPQGSINARQFAQDLARQGFVIVSGLALGVDGAAHEGALAGAAADSLATIAVVGTGLDRVYPRQHLDLAHRIVQSGVLLSEYPLGTPPLAANFPQRNRLIAGLARGTLVVEAALQSGSLITARLAAEQGKEVFAIPGSIHSTQARGCHALIKQGAKLVECAQDVTDELTPVGGRGAGGVDAVQRYQEPLFDHHDALQEALGFFPIGLDALLARTGLDTASLQARLMEMEIEGQVSRLPGGLFQRTVRV